MLLKLLDRLEEVLIGTLMAAATVITFATVVHRFLSGIPALQDYTDRIDFGWSQELCIYMFIWVAKFGAAYGVRTGIHVGVDVLINRLPSGPRGVFVMLGLLAGALFTGTVAVLGARLVWENGMHWAVLTWLHRPTGDIPEGPTTPDLEWRTWVVYAAIPLGSSLMCFRFLQVARAFLRTGDLPRHDHGHVEGLDSELPLVGEALQAGEAMAREGRRDEGEPR